MTEEFKYIREYWQRWSGDCVGVSYEIAKAPPFYEGRRERWAAYLSINLERIPDDKWRESLWLAPEKDDKGRLFYRYHESWIADLDWHGGMTFYNKRGAIDGADRIVKVGCDYQHYWDEDRDYDLAYVEYETQELCKEFRERVPDYKCYCQTVGGVWAPEEGVFSKQGRFISNKGMEWQRTNYPKADESEYWWNKEAPKR